MGAYIGISMGGVTIRTKIVAKRLLCVVRFSHFLSVVERGAGNHLFDMQIEGIYPVFIAMARLEAASELQSRLSSLSVASFPGVTPQHSENSPLDR